MIGLKPKTSQIFFVYRIQRFFFTEKELFKEKKGYGGSKKNE